MFVVGCVRRRCALSVVDGCCYLLFGVCCHRRRLSLFAVGCSCYLLCLVVWNGVLCGY